MYNMLVMKDFKFDSLEIKCGFFLVYVYQYILLCFLYMNLPNIFMSFLMICMETFEYL